MKPWLLHPMAVHFPVALLLTAFALHARALRAGDGDWSAPASRRLLWLGALGAWAALGLGLLAEKTVPHVPGAWEVQARHEELAWWTCGVFTAASLLVLWMERKGEGAPAWGRVLLTALWLGGLAALGLTARDGGRLVYDYNVGTAASAD